ncbi:uncharacterized protein LOC123539063 [Mercenaria mercenaria]|uniref:uncharacterized protein LOC123539063 n=1 Tax=Mercenaria mercenaria TaxID=6596 RepID=UPI001E1D9D29|nr:uncharacterized protein LOC123539063 [Mercenaria mercenaria]
MDPSAPKPEGPIGAGGWKNHLFGCFNNFQIAITTFLLPFVTFGTTAEAVGEGNCIVCAAAFFIPFFNCYEWVKIRGKIREMRGIPGTPTQDLVIILFCSYCALAQEAQEMDTQSPSAQSMSRA